MNFPASFLLRWTATLVMFVLNIVAIYFLLRGHNEPGGGFIGGLVSAMSFLLYGVATGLAELEKKIRLDPIHIATWGLLLALLSACAPILVGAKFLEHFQTYIHLPIWGETYVGTPLAFDIGVMMVVIGISTKIMFVLARSTGGNPPLLDHETARYSSKVEIPLEKKEADHGA